MSKSPFFIAFLLVNISSYAWGQSIDRHSGIGLRVNSANYLWPLTHQFYSKDFKLALEAEYSGKITGPLHVAVPLKLGSASFPKDDNGNVEEGGRISLDVLFQLQLISSESFFVPYIFVGGGAVLEKAKKVNWETPLGVGLDFRLSSGTYLSIKGEYRVGIADYRNNIQLGTGITFFLGSGEETLTQVSNPDMDGDGLLDSEDLCPQEPGSAQTKGCPDRDKDGIADGNDSCPDLPGLWSMRGCPDSDNDGISDDLDACPLQPGPGSNQGCPTADADGDGLSNDQDECPEQAGPKALRGCPDKDGDGVPDNRDYCPEEPGLTRVDGCPDKDNDGVVDREDYCPEIAGPASNRGCPELTREEKEVLTFASQAVQFETGSNRLTSQSYPVLDQIASIMVRYPAYNLRISGHTDSVGSSRANQQLSEQRAKTCYDYLTSQTVPGYRMIYIGYGEAVPVADNRYETGRKQNRRVVFELYLRH